jgi:hypothetical protein
MARLSFEEESPSFLSEAKRIGTGAGLSALKGLESLVIGVPTFLGVPEPSAGRPSDIIQELGGLTPEYLSPQNYPEMALQKFAKYAPLSGGLTSAQGLIRSGLGALSGGAAQYAELPEWAQDVAQLGTEVGVGIGQKAIPTLRGAQKAEDIAARASVPSLKRVAANDFTKIVSDVENKLPIETDRNVYKSIRHTLDKVLGSIKDGKISPTEAMDLRKNLYKTASKMDKGKAAEYIQPLTEGINQVFAQYSVENPQFYRHLTSRDKITALKNMQPIVGDFIDSLTSWFKPAQLLATPIKAIFNEGERFIRGVANNNAARKYYFDATKAALGNNPALFVENANKLIDQIKPAQQKRFTFEN